MRELLQLVLDTGLLQFGSFSGSPYKWHLEYLPSYPDVLKVLAGQAAEIVQTVDHMVCPASALPLATAISLRTNIPLVYGAEGASTSTPALIGAYDIGHPAALVVNDLADASGSNDCIDYAALVGLEIKQVITLVGFRDRTRPDMRIDSVFEMQAVIGALRSENLLTACQYETIQRWLSNHHPG